jgi:hypothetical protein
MNQYRCETCQRRTGLIDGPEDCPIRIPSHLDEPRVWLIEQIGCASHSDFQSEQFTEDELSDLFIVVDANIERHGKRTSVVKLLDKIEELRGKP